MIYNGKTTKMKSDEVEPQSFTAVFTVGALALYAAYAAVIIHVVAISTSKVAGPRSSLATFSLSRIPEARCIIRGLQSVASTEFVEEVIHCLLEKLRDNNDFLSNNEKIFV